MKMSYRSVLFVLIVLIPLGLFSIYELRIATSRYHSDSMISITEDKKIIPTLDLSAIGLSSSGDSTDAMTLITFMNSPDMIAYLDEKLQVRKHYSHPAIDWWSRLPPNSSKEDFLDYIRGMISVSFDPLSHLVQIHVQAFSREYAQSIVRALLERSQEFVDRLNSKMNQEKIGFLEKQLATSDVRLRKAKDELLTFQRANGLLTADSEANIVNSSIAALNSQLLAKQGQLEVSLKELDETSPIVKRTKSEIDTLKKQISAEKDRLSVGTSGAPISAITAQFADIQANVNFVESIYKANLGQLEAAKVEALQRLKYLIVVTQPSIADSSLYPARGYNVITAAVILLMAFFIISLMIAVVREHV